MNSRDAAYDEAEQLRRAIEESKKELGGSVGDEKTRRNKRSRSDSQEYAVLNFDLLNTVLICYQAQGRRKTPKDNLRLLTILRKASPSQRLWRRSPCNPEI